MGIYGDWQAKLNPREKILRRTIASVSLLLGPRVYVYMRPRIMRVEATKWKFSLAKDFMIYVRANNLTYRIVYTRNGDESCTRKHFAALFTSISSYMIIPKSFPT